MQLFNAIFLQLIDILHVRTQKYNGVEVKNELATHELIITYHNRRSGMAAMELYKTVD